VKAAGLLYAAAALLAAISVTVLLSPRWRRRHPASQMHHDRRHRENQAGSLNTPAAPPVPAAPGDRPGSAPALT
jgi:hypothetical protein